MIELLTYILGLLTGAGVVYYLLRLQLAQLNKQNGELLDAMYHRIGYNPEARKAQPTADVASAPYVAPEKFTEGFPDLFLEQRKAIEKSESVRR